MLVPEPDGIAPEAIASVSDNVSDAWRTVGPQLEAEPGAAVLVVGGDAGPGSIGLCAAGISAVGFDPSIVTSDVVPWDDAVAALSDPPTKLAVARSQ